jgi:hypothetical protein
MPSKSSPTSIPKPSPKTTLSARGLSTAAASFFSPFSSSSDYNLDTTTTNNATTSHAHNNHNTVFAAGMNQDGDSSDMFRAMVMERRGSTPSAFAIKEASARSSISKTTLKVMKSTVKAPMVAGKKLVQGGKKAGNAAVTAGNAVVTAGTDVVTTMGNTVVFGGKAAVEGGMAVVAGTSGVVLGGGKAFMDGTQTVAKGVVKGVKKVSKATMSGMSGSGTSTRFLASDGKKTQWDEGVQVIDEILRPESETYAVLTPEQRKALKNVKRLLLKGPNAVEDKMQHVPRDLLYVPRGPAKPRMEKPLSSSLPAPLSSGSSRKRGSHNSSGSNNNNNNNNGSSLGGIGESAGEWTVASSTFKLGAATTSRKSKRLSRSFLLEEYAGLKSTSSLDDDITDTDDSEQDELSPAVPTIQDVTDGKEETTNVEKLVVAPSLPVSAVSRSIPLEEGSIAATSTTTTILTPLFTPPEFKQLSNNDQKQLCHMLSWQSITSWDFNIFDLDRLTHNNPLLFMGWAVLGSPYAQLAMAQECGMDLVDYSVSGGYDFMDQFQIPPNKLCNYLRVVEQDYHTDNPYHNAIHAADVLQTLNALIQMTLNDCKTATSNNNGGAEMNSTASWIQSCPSIKFFTILLSAAVHDIDHPGKTNAFHTKLHTELAVVYNDISVLENWHVARAFARMLDLSLLESNIHSSQVILSAASHTLYTQQKESEYNILCNINSEEFNTIRNLMIEAVLHTDMTKHFAMVNATKGLLMSSTTSHGDEADETTLWKLLMYMLHMADISSQAKGPHLFRLWTERCMAEFFAQGDQEAQLGLPISPNCDRTTTNTAESQVGFIKFVVEPAYEVLGQFIPTVQERVLPIIERNWDHWKAEKDKDEMGSSVGSFGSLASIDELGEEMSNNFSVVGTTELAT